MSLFNFFRRSKTVVVHENSNSTDASATETPIAQELFVENEVPADDQKDTNEPNTIQGFLKQEFEAMGYHDGYAYPDGEFLASKTHEIKANFRYTLDETLEGLRIEIGELRIHKIRIAGLSARFEDQIAEKIKTLESHIHELDTEKILMIEGNGLVEAPLSAYKLGFLKGIDRYQQEKFLAGNTRLFNR